MADIDALRCVIVATVSLVRSMSSRFVAPMDILGLLSVALLSIRPLLMVFINAILSVVNYSSVRIMFVRTSAIQVIFRLFFQGQLLYSVVNNFLIEFQVL